LRGHRKAKGDRVEGSEIQRHFRFPAIVLNIPGGGNDGMPKHSHRFVEEYDGLVGFGLDRQTDEGTLTWYLQKFSDDTHMALLRERMSDQDMAALFDTLGGLVKKYLNEEEYHQVFLKEYE
jgi:hypothetical protein